jgi:hypothetical protein
MKTVVVTLTDLKYFNKAKRTIIDIRTRGEWIGDFVLITVDFNPSKNFLDYYNITQFRVSHINTNNLLEKYKQCPIRPTCDNREYAKLTQWDKFYVFHDYFKKWNKVIFFDAGIRIFDKIEYLNELPYENSFLAPDDAAPDDNEKTFKCIIETDKNIPVVEELFKEYSKDILQQRYFLNCLWVYDTNILSLIKFNDLVDAMNKYPICRCNEMTIMNLFITFKYKLWKPFPEFLNNSNKRLFAWNEYNHGYNTTWRDFCYIKYPSTINFECE